MTEREKQRTGYADRLSEKLGLRVTYYRHPCSGKWRGSYDVGFMIGDYTVALGNTWGDYGKKTQEVFRQYESVEKALIQKLTDAAAHAVRFPETAYYVKKALFFNEILTKLGGDGA